MKGERMKTYLIDLFKSKEEREKLKVSREEEKQKEMKEIQEILKNPTKTLEELNKLSVDELLSLVKKYQKAVELAPTADAKMNIGMEGMTIASLAQTKNFDAVCNDFMEISQNGLRASLSGTRSTNRLPAKLEKIKESKLACVIAFLSVLVLGSAVKSCSNSKASSRDKVPARSAMNYKENISDRTMAGIRALMEDPHALDIKVNDSVSKVVVDALSDISNKDKGNVVNAKALKNSPTK